jgi:soluble lytic murein transglycosylase-like protein
MRKKNLFIKLGLLQKMVSLLKELFYLHKLLEKKRLEAMIRRVAREEGVPEEIILAVIKCESGLNPKAINKNKDGTTDYGLCQFNDFWYRDLITPEEALNEPEKAVRLMCRQFKKGRAFDWVCYRSGKYKEFLT